MAPPRTLDLPYRECLRCKRTFRALMWARKDAEPYVQKYCSGTCRNFARGAAKGTVHKRTGYRYFMINGKSIAEHTIVMQKKLGRKLAKEETVHHINGDRLDNRPENLELWASRHGKGQRVSDLPPVCSGMIAEGALSLGA